MPLTPPLSNHPHLPTLSSPALLVADHAQRIIHHCTGDTEHLTAQSAGPCSAIRQRALTADICENRLLTDAFTGSTAGQLSETPLHTVFYLATATRILTRRQLRAKVSACLW